MRSTSRWWFLGSGLVVLLLAPFARCADATPLLRTNSIWRLFRGSTEPSPNNFAAWRDAGFSDTTWSESPAPFWYGEAARFGGTGTELPEMQNTFSTLYLRRRFTVTNPAAFESLDFAVMVDDGYLAWLNGTLIASQLPPAASPTFDALAGGNAEEPVAFQHRTINDAASRLVTGDNVLAVQVFNTSLGSSDIVFDAELSAVPFPTGSPTLVSVLPPPGPLTTLTEITVTFSEPVRGVRAEDFLVNGSSATAVQGSGTSYTFTFPQPPFGAIGVSWTTFNTIEDFESPPRRFELADPASTWGYELIDPEGPSVAAVQPPSGSTLRGLTQVEVSFDKAVNGVDASDLLLQGHPATNVTGVAAGPYLFEFAAAPSGPVTLSWAANHGIVSDNFEPHPLRAETWSYTVDPTLRQPVLVLTEFMAENLTSYRDEDRDPEDWIEIHNPTTTAVNLEGWSLSNDSGDPGRWVFPRRTIPAGGYLVVFASGKDRRPTGANDRLHTQFKLNPTGGYLALCGPDLPRVVVSEVSYPEQGADYAYGRENNTGGWRYFKGGSPGVANGTSAIVGTVEPVHFSVTRGFFNSPFTLALACPTPGATIRFTTNGSPPTELEGFLYTNGVAITANRVIRAAAFKSNALPSVIGTHTYLLGLPASRLRLPALSLVTATNNLYGRTGIMEVNPRNTTKRGAAWERPVSVEYVRAEDNAGFQVDAGLRLQGGDYIRGQYNYRSSQLPFSKYSYRLYFRGEYGRGRLEYPLFPETTQRSFDTIVLRAGMNDPTNPFVVDEFVRTLERDCGQPAAVGTFVHLFLNGVYKGYYNPCERIDVDFLRAYHGGGEKWDLMAQFGEVREGDVTAWNALRSAVSNKDLNIRANYQDVVARLDLTNFVDYLCPLIYADNDDWPHNNWRAARERAPGGRYRFYDWDSEWAFGSQGHTPTWDTIRNQLSSTSPPWGGAEIQRLFLGLKKSAEFRLFFADRVHRHFFNGGALVDDRLRLRWASVTNRMRGVISGFNNNVGATWIPQRRRNVLAHLERAGLLASSNAPVITPFGGNVTVGTRVAFSNLTGTIYFTTNGSDPRVAFTGEVAPEAVAYTAPLTLASALTIRARSLQDTNWSAVTETSFQVSQPTLPLRFTEVMYNPRDGEAYEFLELANQGPLPVDLSGFTLDGVDFRFPEPSPLMPAGARWILANKTRPAEFQARYPGVAVAGWYAGSLANGGETLELRDRSGQVVTRLTYGDAAPWPSAADGTGASLELLDPAADPSDPAAWIARLDDTGSPGAPTPAPAPTHLEFAEIAPAETNGADWIELHNPGKATLSLAGWSLSDTSNPRKFVFGEGLSIDAGARLRVWCSTNLPMTTPAERTTNTGFALDRDGATLALYAPDGTRADAITFGPIPATYSLSRLGGTVAWELSELTPGSANERAQLAAPTQLVLNEWLANPSAGGTDWLELHNRDALHPADLRGLHLLTSNQIFQIALPSFVPASGFVALVADGDSGPGHAGLRLPAGGGGLALLDAGGSEINRVTYPAMPENVAYGRLPDGTGTPIATPGTASPGASNYVTTAGGPRLNEFVAQNRSATPDPQGRFVDWIELENPGPTAVPLEGYRLGVDETFGDSWSFPVGVALPARGRLMVWCDSSTPASTNASGALNLGRGLPVEGATLRLFSPFRQVLDSVTYGPQLENVSVGQVEGSWRVLALPTPGAANSAPAELGSVTTVRINEWRAGSASGEDWIELYNPEPLPVDLGNSFLTDDPSLAGITKFTLPPLSLVAPHGHQLWQADGPGHEGGNHTGFALDALGESLRFYSFARSLVDAVDFGPQARAGSEGRFPDGNEAISTFAESPSPESANWLPHPAIAIHEVLAHTDAPLEDAIECLNEGPRAVDLSGWFVSNDAANLRKQKLPDERLLPAGAFRVLYEYQFNPADNPLAFTLNSAHGDHVWLSEADSQGNLTGYRAHAEIGATANGISFGRHRTSVGWDYAPMSRRTFGHDAPISLADFRQGTGLSNAYPLVGPVVITEINLHPLLDAGTTNVSEPADEEFLELHNPTSQPVALFDPAAPTNTWRIRGGVRYDFPRQATLPAGAFALVLPFSPTNTSQLAAFRSRYPSSAKTLVFGPFEGRLADDEDDLRLERPDPPQLAPHPDAGFVPYVLVERVHYRSDAFWPVLTADTGASLQRRRVVEYANDPANWIAASPTAGAPTSAPSVDRDLDGLPNDWEIAHGLNPDDPSDAALDSDGDGSSNHAELLAGTDPRDAASRLTLTVQSEASVGWVLRFRAIADRAYAIEGTEEVPSPRWQRQAWIEAMPYDRDVSLPISAAATATGDRPWFFRVTTPAEP